MPSKVTEPVAGRVPNHVADQLRDRARRDGLTTSSVVGAVLRQALATNNVDVKEARK
jgi:hypothetical protein